MFLNLLIAASAVLVAVTYMRDRERASRASSGELVATRESRWEELVRDAEWIGPRDAKVAIVEFADFQCPFCAVFHESVKKLREENPSTVAVAIVHFPLPIHKHAVNAALASNCAAEQGRFAEMAAALYESQDSIGILGWHEFATRAGVTNFNAFNLCIQSARQDTLQDRANSRAALFDVRATPTVFINGWRLSYAPPVDSLRRVVRDVLADRNPYD